MTYLSNKDPLVEHAIQIIAADYGANVTLEAKNKDLIKFGRNQLVQTTKSTLMTLPSGQSNETYITTNGITTVSSTSTVDAQPITVEGHTVDGSGNFTFATQSLTLTGQTQATLTTSLARVTRAYNTGSLDLSGTIYFYRPGGSSAGVPTTAVNVHMMIAPGLNNTEKASTTLSNDDYWVITNFYADCLEKTATFGIVHLEIRLKGGVFRNKLDRSCNDTNHVFHQLKPFIIVPPNSDVRLRVSASASNKDFSGGISGFLLKA